MKEIEANIQIQLLSINEIHFMMSPDKMDNKLDDVRVGFSNNVELDSGKDRISIVFGVRYIKGEEILLESVYRFGFAVKNLKTFVVKKDENVITIKNLVPHFLNVAIGTMRGILVVKTAGTSLSKMILPIFDSTELSKKLSKSKN